MVNDMKKIFKSKKNKKINLKKILLILLISFSFAFIISKINILKNIKFINLLKKTSMNELTLKDINLKGEYLINIGLNNFEKIKFDKVTFKQNNKEEKELNPRIYIYNTHQTEEYRTIENYNLTPTVHTASYILKDLLKQYNIGVIVEDSDLKTDMNKLGVNYNNAYEVSKYWLNNLGRNDLDLYIDLHRDSTKYNLSNVTINGKDYAKIMFVMGNNYDYQDNLDVATKLINEVEKINKEISRGIFTRKKSVYNQDFNKNCVLIEVGGPESTYESVSNTLNVLALAIKNYLGE